MERLVPVVGLAGYSGSGKTTFLEKLIAELKSRGYRVGVIKHTSHPVEFDQPGKDTWRHARAGADVVALASPDKIAVFKKYISTPGPEDVLPLVEGVDLIIIEGFKKGSWPKIEIIREEVPERPVIPTEELLAKVGGSNPVEGVPCYGLEDAPAVADLLEQHFLKKSNQA
jgi:molybdopterin-guanine dinucleotide biosynthesis protein B